jgi:hypothetical protein
MTQQEHWLVVGALAQQMQISIMLLEILKTNDLISSDAEIPAFAALASLAPEVSVQHVGEAYLAVARRLGLELNLTPPPPA